MTDIRQGRGVELDDQTPNARISWLVRTLFKGKQREAAREFGISQAVLSKIVRNEQVAGQRVLAAVAAHPRVSPHWLYNGVGEPLLTETGELPVPLTSDPPVGEVGPTLPVAGQFLPGPPAEFSPAHPQEDAGRESRLRADAVLLGGGWGRPDPPRAKGEKVVPADCLLMETNRRLWIDYLPILNGRLMVVRLGGEHSPNLVLARGDSQPEEGYLTLNTFGIMKSLVRLALAPAEESISMSW